MQCFCFFMKTKWALLVGVTTIMFRRHGFFVDAAAAGSDGGGRCKTCITWVNGIGHSVEHMKLGQTFISKQFGSQPVYYCHNPTAMSHETDVLGYVSDLTQAGTQKLGLVTAEVDSLVQHLKQAIKDVGGRNGNGRVIHIAHSQGALITYLACKKLSKDELSHMEVICFGGAAAIRRTPQTPFLRCINYYSINDPLLLVVPEAAQALRSGFVVYSHSMNDGFCFLAPKLGDPIEDHNLLGPTYGQALEWEGKRYQQLYLSRYERWSGSMVLLVSWVVRLVSAQLYKLARSLIVHPLTMWCVACWNATRSCLDTMEHVMRVRLLKPLVELLVLLLHYVQQKTTQRGEKYVPVPVALLRQQQQDQQTKEKRSNEGT